MCFLLERLLYIFNLIFANQILTLIISFYISSIFFPLYFAFSILTEDKNKKILDFFAVSLIILAISSIFDYEIVVTSNIKIIASLKFIIFIALSISISSIYSLVLLWNKRDAISLYVFSILCSSIVAGFLTIKLNKQYYALGDYYEDILYLPIKILSLSFHAAAFMLLATRYQSSRRIIFLISLIILVLPFGLLVFEKSWVLQFTDKITNVVRFYYLGLFILDISNKKYTNLAELILLAINNNVGNIAVILVLLKYNGVQSKILSIIKITMIFLIIFSMKSSTQYLSFSFISYIAILPTIYIIYLENKKKIYSIKNIF